MADVDLTIHHDRLLTAVNWAATAAARNPPVPILGGLRIVADREGIAVTGTDWERTHSAVAAADVLVAGTTVLSANLLSAIAKSLPVGQIRIQEDGGRVTITAPRTRYSLPKIGTGEDFGSGIGESADATAGAVFGSELALAVKRAEGVSRVSKDGDPPSLQGIWLTVIGDGLELLAPSRHRASYQTVAIAEGSLSGAPVCVPYGQLGATLHGAPRLYWRDGVVVVQTESNGVALTAWLRTLAAESPSPQLRRMAVGAVAIATFDRADLLDAIEAVSISVTDARTRLDVELMDGEATLSTTVDDETAATRTLGCESVVDRHEFSVSVQYLTDSIKSLAGETVGLYGQPNRPKTASVWRAEGSEQILAPMAGRVKV